MTGDGRALIDAQTLISGANEGPFQPPADNYRLDLDSGGAVTADPERQAPHGAVPDAGQLRDQLGRHPTDELQGPGLPVIGRP